MPFSVSTLALGLGAFLAISGGIVPSTSSDAQAASGARRATASKVTRGRASAVRGATRRPGQRAVRRVAPRRTVIPWLRGNLPNVQAQGALVIDLQDGEELFARHADTPRPIASISKLAAALVVVERGLALDAFTSLTRVDLDVARGGARSRLFEGMNISNRDLLHAALLGSDNRAVSALGRASGLDAAALASAMTRKARELGLTQTRFVEPTGLSPENQSTPREAIVLLRAVMDHPVLGPITRTVERDVHPVGRPPIKYLNTHRPASRSNTAVLGGKTGFNNAARYCLVLAAEVGGRVLGMAFLGTEGELTRFGDVGRVSDWVVAYRARGGKAPGPAGTSLASADPTPPARAAASAPELPGLTPPPLTAVIPSAGDETAARAGSEAPPPASTPDLPPAPRP